MGSHRPSRAAQATAIVAVLALACVPSGAGDLGTPSRGQDPGSGVAGADVSGQGRGEREEARNEKSCISACTPEGTCSCIPIPRAKKASTTESVFEGELRDWKSDVGIGILQGRRVAQEDVVSVHNLPPIRGQPRLDRPPLFAAVYDGHRGKEAARFAGELLHVKTAQRMEYIKGDIGAALAGAIAELDEEFLQRAREEGLRDGSTAVAAVFAGGRLTVAHVGDSRCVLVGIDDEGHYISEVLTEDHKPNLERERMRVMEGGGWINHDGVHRVLGELAVTRALGNAQLKQHVISTPDVSSRRIMIGDEAVILASDGLWDALTPAQAADFILPRLLQGQPASDVGRSLVDLAYDLGSSDNIACVIVSLLHMHSGVYDAYSGVAPEVISERGDAVALMQKQGVLIGSRSAQGQYEEDLSRGDRVGAGGRYVLGEMLSVVRSKPHSSTLMIGPSGGQIREVPVLIAKDHERQLQARIGELERQLLQGGGGHQAYLAIGAAYEALGDEGMAVKYLEEGIRAGGGKEGSMALLEMSGRLHQSLSLHSRAMELHAMRLGAAQRGGDADVAAAAAADLARAYHSLGMPVEASALGSAYNSLDLPTTVGVPGTGAALIEAAWGAPESLRYAELSDEATLVIAAANAHGGSILVRKSESEGKGGGSGGGPQPAKLLGAMLTLPTIEGIWGDGRLGEGGIEGSSLAGGDGGEEIGGDGGERASETHSHLPAKRLRGDIAAQGRHEGDGGRREGVRGAEGALHGAYEMRESIGQGKFGEVWKARVYGQKESQDGYVLKRLFVEKGHAVLLSGLREAYFGSLLRGASRVCRFVESFEEKGVNGTSLWLVFHNEGLSLRHYLYEGTVQGNMVHYTASEMWTRTRASPEGPGTLRTLIRQLIEGVADCHRRNVTHRDLKPENLIVHIPTPDEVGQGGSAAKPVLKLADFGSAVNEESIRKLYGLEGPSLQDETLDYAPPEVLFGSGATYSSMRPQSYDMWSVGVIFLELVLGTSKVFQVDARTRSIIDQKMRHTSEAVREQAFLFRAMVELCIYPPLPLDEASKNEVIPARCSDQAVLDRLRKRDPLGLAFADVWAVKLLRRLLRWSPQSRLTAERALQHAYFKEEGGGFECGAGVECEFRV